MSTDSRWFVVDRIEGDVVFLEADDGEVHELDRSRLSVVAREGVVLRIGLAADGSLDDTRVELDEEETARRLREAAETLDELRKRDPGGDVVLG